MLLFLLGVLGNLLAAVIWDQLPAISKLLVRFNAARLPVALRDRFSREWLAEVKSYSSATAQFWFAFRLTNAVPGIRHASAWPSVPHRPATDVAIRVLDIVQATMALMLLTPLFCMLKVISVFTGYGRFVERFRRVGRAGRLFDELYIRVPITPSGEGVNRLGRWILRFRFNTMLPLLNVIRGDLSLVGPRSYSVHDPRFAAGFVRPGVIGHGVILPPDISKDARREHDMNWSSDRNLVTYCRVCAHLVVKWIEIVFR